MPGKPYCWPPAKTTYYEKEELLKALSRHYYIQEAFANKPVLPQEKHLLGLYFADTWYHMAAKPHTSRHPGLAGRLDSAILQREVFEPVFGISDPKNDPRLKHTGGDKALTEMEALLEAHPHAVAFTLSPLSAEDLLSVSDLGEVLPPKSTWIDPKIPYGLILYQHKKQTNNEKHYDPGNRRLRTDRLRTHHRFT